MNTNDNNSTSQPTPRPGIHPGVWIGGGVMAVAIVALATTLAVKSSHPDAPNADGVPLMSAAGSSAPLNSTGTTQTGGQGQNTPGVGANHEHSVRHATAERGRSESMRRDDPSFGQGGDGSQQVAAIPACTNCGVIDSYTAVQVQGQNNGVGAVAGGLGGALIGSKIGGRGNHTLGGVIGAVGGGLLGNAVESHERAATVYDVHVRMNDGSIRTVRQSTIPAVGTHVRVDGNTLHAEPSQG
ncbi:MAG: glycine zipper 2TM domain-containing protein [Caulobacter sp.]|nr:glycine zipper 2TM domain-containing protein [Vitreoscilla sp.]